MHYIEGVPATYRPELTRCTSPYGAAVPLPPRASWAAPVVARAALLAGPCFTDGQGSPVEWRLVEGRHGRLGLGGVGHLDKAKAPGPAGDAISDDPDAFDGAIGLEELAEFVFGRAIRQIRDVNVHSCSSCLARV